MPRAHSSGEYWLLFFFSMSALEPLVVVEVMNACGFAGALNVFELARRAPGQARFSTGHAVVVGAFGVEHVLRRELYAEHALEGPTDSAHRVMFLCLRSSSFLRASSSSLRHEAAANMPTPKQIVSSHHGPHARITCKPNISGTSSASMTHTPTTKNLKRVFTSDSGVAWRSGTWRSARCRAAHPPLSPAPARFWTALWRPRAARPASGCCRPS